MTSKPVDILHKLPPLKALTSVRFLAALYVALFHTGFDTIFRGVPVVVRFLRSGYTGVTFFFVLSGFILAYNYPAIRSKKAFWIARFARVYPVYLLSVPLAILTHFMRGRPHPLLSLVLVLGLVQAWWPPLFQAINPVAWTLSVEAFFYLLLPFMLPFMRRLGWKAFVGIETAYLVLIVSPLLMNAWHLPVAADFTARYLESNLPLFRLNPFIVGVFLGLRWNALQVQRNIQSPLKTKRHWWVLLGTGASLLLLQLTLTQIYLPLRTFALTYTFALLIAGLADNENPLLTNHWAQMAGEISYGFYILQFPVIAICGDIQSRIAPSVNYSDAGWVYLPALVLFAYASFRWFEIPARLSIRNVLSGKPVPVREV